MRLALFLTFVTALLLDLIGSSFGNDVLFQIASGGIVVMAAVIGLTFLWLWQVRATPLALGMAFSWAGVALVLAWWWVLAAIGAATAMNGHPGLLVFVAIFTTGAVLHFAVIGSSLTWPRFSAAAVPILAFALSTLATWIVFM